MDDSVPQRASKRQPRTEPIFYTYMYYRNGIPFYVGKGHDRRIEHHFDCARNHKSCKHRVCRVIRKEWREGGEITTIKIAEGIPEQAAFDLEKLFISLGAVYQWPLVNQTIGGEGVSGYIRDAEWRRRRSELTKRLVAEGKFDHLKDQRITNFITPEIIEKRNEGIRRAWSDPELQEMRRQQTTQMWEIPGHREKQRQGLQQFYKDHPEVRQQQSEASKRNWGSHEYREKVQAAMAQPEVKAKLRSGRLGKPPANTKTYTGFLAPDGVTIYKDVYNLAAFCEEYGLSKSKMCLVAQGKRQSHKGWTLYPPLEKTEKPTVYYFASFQSPSGEVFAGIESLSAFCREHSLQRSNMILVARGEQQSHKGWTLYPPIEFDTRTYHGPGFVSPEGHVYADIRHLSAFCEEHGLSQPVMSQLAHGSIKTYKGWKRHEPEIQ